MSTRASRAATKKRRVENNQVEETEVPEVPEVPDSDIEATPPHSEDEDGDVEMSETETVAPQSPSEPVLKEMAPADACADVSWNIAAEATEQYYDKIKFDEADPRNPEKNDIVLKTWLQKSRTEDGSIKETVCCAIKYRPEGKKEVYWNGPVMTPSSTVLGENGNYVSDQPQPKQTTKAAAAIQKATFDGFPINPTNAEPNHLVERNGIKVDRHFAHWMLHLDRLHLWAMHFVISDPEHPEYRDIVGFDGMKQMANATDMSDFEFLRDRFAPLTSRPHFCMSDNWYVRMEDKLFKGDKDNKVVIDDDARAQMRPIEQAALTVTSGKDGQPPQTMREKRYDPVRLKEYVMNQQDDLELRPVDPAVADDVFTRQANMFPGYRYFGSLGAKHHFKSSLKITNMTKVNENPNKRPQQLPIKDESALAKMRRLVGATGRRA